MSSEDLTDDPHPKERGYLVQLEHPEVGRRIHAGIPWKMSASSLQRLQGRSAARRGHRGRSQITAETERRTDPGIAAARNYCVTRAEVAPKIYFASCRI
jgi:hypothetical protein